MKKLMFILLLSLFAIQVQSQSWQSSNRLLSDSEVVLISSESDENDASIYMFGYFTGSLTASSGESVTSVGGRDYFIAKFDSLSNVLWLKNLGSALSDYVGGGLDVAVDGSVYITGGFRDEFFYTVTESITSTGGFDTFILKYDSDGNVIWIKHSGQGPLNQRPNALGTDDAGDVIISGFFSDSISFDGEDAFKSNNAIDDFYYAKFSQVDGTLTWANQCRGIDNIASGRITSISTEAGSYAFAGLFQDSISIVNDTLVSESNSIDVFVMKTDLDGNVTWLRQVSGADDEYSYTLSHDGSGSGDLFLGGFFNNVPLVIDSTETEQVQYDNHLGGFDIMLIKYGSDGTYQWMVGAGGLSTDKVWDLNSQDTVSILTGSFDGSMMWGGVELVSEGGSGDVDMYIGVATSDGEFLNANRYGGRSNSREEGRAVFENNGNTYVVLRSDSDLLVLGDSSYVSPGGDFYLVMGVIGCKTVNVDFVNTTDLECYGDSSGSMIVIASGGFGGPYKYSIDNGESYFENNGIFTNLPALDYQIKVLDNQHCIGTGPSGTISQPDSIQFNYTVTAPLCPDSLLGAISFETPTGGSDAGWEFSIDSGATYQTVAMFEDLAIDNYYLVVKENMDCESAIIDTMVINPDPIMFDFDLLMDSLACYSDTDGEIHFKDVTGGTGSYEFSIDQATFGSDTFFIALGSGDYSLVVRDANNCLSIVTDTSIYEPEELTLVLLDSANIMGDTDGYIEVLASGGTLPFTYKVAETGAEQEADTANFTFSKGDEGTFTVEVSDGNDCGPVAIASIDIVYIPGVGIDENNLLSVKIYPNPASRMITLEVPYDAPECTLEVLSLTGQVIMSRKAFTNGGLLKETIDVSDLSKGMYIIRVDGQTLRSGVVVN